MLSALTYILGLAETREEILSSSLLTYEPQALPGIVLLSPQVWQKVISWHMELSQEITQLEPHDTAHAGR